MTTQAVPAKIQIAESDGKLYANDGQKIYAIIGAVKDRALSEWRLEHGTPDETLYEGLDDLEIVPAHPSNIPELCTEQLGQPTARISDFDRRRLSAQISLINQIRSRNQLFSNIIWVGIPDSIYTFGLCET